MNYFVTKAELRKIYLEKRISLSPVEHADLSRAITDRLFAEIDFRSIRTFDCYIALAHFGEVETGLIFRRAWEQSPQTVTTAPRINYASGEIESILYIPETRLIESKWRIPEPDGRETIAPEALDLIIAPLLCFDAKGHRVGYGRGFYDRLLQKCRPDCIKAGLSFFPPITAVLDVHEADVPLDLCFTPGETYRFPQTISPSGCL